MLLSIRHMVVFTLLSAIGLFLLPVSTTFALSPKDSYPLSFGLNLTLGNHNCDLEARNLDGIFDDDMRSLKNYSPVIFRVPQSCVAVLARLRASIDQAVWLSLAVDEQTDWLKLHTVQTDENPPSLDKRGRYFGCAMPENGFHTCRVGFEMNGQRYQVLVPMRVGVLGEYRRSAARPAKDNNIKATSTSDVKAVAADNIRPAGRTGRGLSIPGIGFYSGITTFPLTNGTWQIAVEEPLVGHLQGTAWINDQSNIVLGGHSRYSSGASGIFAGLYNVDIGQEVILNDQDVERRYVVTDIRIIHYKDVSIVFPNQGDQLTMLTCHIPSYNQATNNYDQRLVVIAKPV